MTEAQLSTQHIHRIQHLTRQELIWRIAYEADSACQLLAQLGNPGGMEQTLTMVISGSRIVTRRCVGWRIAQLDELYRGETLTSDIFLLDNKTFLRRINDNPDDEVFPHGTDNLVVILEGLLRLIQRLSPGQSPTTPNQLTSAQ